MGSKIISFSLWGNKEMYVRGALENIRLAKQIYPDWSCLFYVDKTVSEDVEHALLEEGAYDVNFIRSDKGAFWGMFWRFFTAEDPSVDIFICRDCDSRLSPREKAAVDEWLASDKCFHTMHDHYAHRSVPVLGGMWGAKKGCADHMLEKILHWGRYDVKGIDQIFLRDKIWPSVKDKSMNHSSIENLWAESRPFPKHSASSLGVQYVGEIFDENNNSVPA